MSRSGARWPGGFSGAVGVASLAGMGALIFLSNPVHQEFYLRLLFVAVPKPPARAMAIVLPGERRAASRPGVPPADDEGRVVVPIADAVPARLPAAGVPPGWDVKEFAGRAAVELVRADDRLALRLRTDRSSFAIFRDVVLALEEVPYLTWSWKVTRLPAEADGREAGRDDQAAAVYVIFPRWPSPRTSSDVLGYVWDTRAPIGTRLVSARAGNVRTVVVESGTAGLKAWRRIRRNVVEDYVALFGRQPPRVGKVALMADSDHTRAETEAYVADLAFSRRP